MTNPHRENATAFVIMPFDAAFDSIYRGLIRATMEEAGFKVARADENTNSQNAMRTIITLIEDSCVIVADLTDSNPNVYYELALAHALHKPVIVLTQDIEDLRFDINAYQVIQYSTHFDEVDKARDALRKSAEGIFTGATLFGNPYSDYTDTEIRPSCAGTPAAATEPSEASESSEQDDPPGILDHQAKVEEGFEDLQASTASIGTRTEEVAEQMDDVSERLSALQNAPTRPPDQARQQRILIMMLAQELNSYARFLADENDTYAGTLEYTRPALEATLQAAEPHTEEDMQALETLLSTIDGVEEATRSFRDSTTGAAAAMREMPNVERSFTRARNLVVEQMRRLTGNIEQTLSMISRAREIAQAMQDEASEA